MKVLAIRSQLHPLRPFHFLYRKFCTALIRLSSVSQTRPTIYYQLITLFLDITYILAQCKGALLLMQKITLVSHQYTMLTSQKSQFQHFVIVSHNFPRTENFRVRIVTYFYFLVCFRPMHTLDLFF